MVIHYDKYPILQFFDKELLPKLGGKINLREEDLKAWGVEPGAINTARSFIKEMYNGRVADLCGENIFIIARPFFEAMNRSANAFRNISRGVELEKLFSNCCIIVGNMTYVAYKIEEGPFKDDYMLSIYRTGESDNIKGNNIIYAGTMVFRKGDNDHYLFDLALLSTSFEMPAFDYDATEGLIDEFLGILIFKHYAKVELDLIDGKTRKNSKQLNQKLINETSSGINILDSQWYTSVFRNEGFTVRGHFRFYKSCDRLVYVNEFQKHGYHRHAKILDDPTAEPDTTELVHKLDELEKEGYIIQSI